MIFIKKSKTQKNECFFVFLDQQSQKNHIQKVKNTKKPYVFLSFFSILKTKMTFSQGCSEKAAWRLRFALIHVFVRVSAVFVASLMIVCVMESQWN